MIETEQAESRAPMIRVHLTVCPENENYPEIRYAGGRTTMCDYSKSKASFASRGITLNGLRDQLHSLNMRMLLAMQNHNEEAQEDLRQQMAEVQTEIEQMSAGRGSQPGRPKFQMGIMSSS